MPSYCQKKIQAGVFFLYKVYMDDKMYSGKCHLKCVLNFKHLKALPKLLALIMNQMTITAATGDILASFWIQVSILKVLTDDVKESQHVIHFP